MTRPSTRPRPVGAERRNRLVYGIPVWAVDRTTGVVICGEVWVGYVGQSVQTVKEREDQHRAEQSFGDTIVGGSFVIEEGWWTQAELDAREEHYIRHGVALTPGGPAMRPVYNYQHNLDNPQRIEVWRAVEHRQTREPGWERPPRGSAYMPRQRSVPTRSTWAARWNARPSWMRRRWWTRPRRVVAGWSALWLFVATLVGIFVAGGEMATWWDGLAYGSAVATATVGVLLPKPRRSRVRNGRRR